MTTQVPPSQAITKNSLTFYAFILFLFCLPTVSSAQNHTITVDTTLTSDYEIYPFTSSTPIYGLDISGKVTLNSDTSLVRVVLYDTLFNQYLLFESYPLIASQPSFYFNNESDETRYLNGIVPYSLEVRLINSSIEINTLGVSQTFIASADSLRYNSKREMDSIKTQQINVNIAQKQMAWIAGENDVVKLYYSEKKSLFGEKYNLLGFEYYKGGIFDFSFGANGINDYPTIVDNFDWTERHGANIEPGLDEENPYYNGMKGWMTDAKSQKCLHCWVFAPLHATEALVNIYFNELLNFDLSEQELASCVNTDDNCGGGWATNTLAYLKNNGVVDEACFGYDPYEGQNPYYLPSAENVPCENETFNCGDPFKVKISGQSNILNSVLDIKKAIIEKGPIVSLLNIPNHYVVFAGFDKIEEGDIVYEISDVKIEVTKNGVGDNLIGKTCWTVKNSFVSWGENGFGKLYLPITYNTQNGNYEIKDISRDRKAIKTPIIVNGYTDDDISCLDHDQDGYWNWGISSKHPSSCIEENHIKDTEGDPIKDSDDSNPRLGPFDDNYYGVPVAPVMEVSESETAIPNNTFYTFYDPDLLQGETIDLVFEIHNAGNAQLNLFQNIDVGKIEISGDDALNFDVLLSPAFDIEPIGNTAFKIRFTKPDNTADPKMATVTIHLDEEDMDNYVFDLVFTDCPQSLGQTTNITGPAVNWGATETKLFFGDVVVKSGSRLTINGKVAFVSQAKMDIEQGAQVYVDGGLLTALCDELWQGVDVWGDRNKDQYDLANQGYIQVLNNGKISYANKGIETIKNVGGGGPVYPTGGVVIIDNGIIENCEYGVILHPYTNYYPNASTPQPNFSAFTQALFINDENQPATRQLSMFQVDGIYIKGCRFENNAVLNQFTEYTGIYSYETGFSVTHKDMYQFNLPDDKLPTTFKNLDYGIYATGTPALGKVVVENSLFEENIKGVYLSMVNYPVVVQNQFNLRKRFSEINSSFATIGLYINDPSVGFVVEENDFYTELHSSKLQTTKCAGIHLTNTGGYPNEIYNNSFNRLTTGVTAAGSNQDGNGVGLCIKCNDFSRCFNDVYIPNEGGTTNLGIATDQGLSSAGSGNPTLAAGNTFSETDNGVPNNYNYGNLAGCNPLVYTYHGGLNPNNYKLVPDPFYPIITPPQITLQPDENVNYNSKSEACPSNYGSGGMVLMTTTAAYSTELEFVDAYNDTLDLFVDGGDTESLAWDVNMSTPPEATAVRQELLDESPYLSDTVMKAAIAKEDVLPSAMVRDVLVSNPQSAKSNEVLQALDMRNDTMPDYMMDQIMLGQNVYGDKEVLEQHLAGHKTKKGRAMRQLMHHYLSDTTDRAAASDSILSLLTNDNELSSQYRLVMKYLGLQDSAMAYSTLYNIPAVYDLDKPQETAHDLYEDLLDIKWQMHSDTTLPDSATIEALFDIEEYYNTAPGVYARNMLVGLGELTYDEPVYFPDFNKATPIWRRSKKSNTPPSALKVFPNPAGTYFIVAYELQEVIGSNMLVLTNLVGHNILIVDIRKKQDQLVIPTTGMRAGVYILQLIHGSKVQESVKITIVN